jgi:enediyne biosynthesis protein E4
MDKPANFMQRQGRKIAALVMVALLYLGARLPQLTEAEQAELASHFRFSRHELPAIPGHPFRYVRNVHPSLEKICAWISAVGASVAMNDLDGDGLPNDIAYVDTRLVRARPGAAAVRSRDDRSHGDAAMRL